MRLILTTACSALGVHGAESAYVMVTSLATVSKLHQIVIFRLITEPKRE